MKKTKSNKKNRELNKKIIQKNIKNRLIIHKSKLKFILLFIFSFFISFFGILLINKKLSYSINEKKEEKKKENINYSQSKIKEAITLLTNLYYDPLDLINNLKVNNKILLIDVRDKESYDREHIKSAIFFEKIEQIINNSSKESKEIIIYGNYPNEKRILEVVQKFLEKGLKVKILSIGYNQFRHFRVFWLPQSQWEKINPDEWVEINNN